LAQKKTLNVPPVQKRAWIEPHIPDLSIVRQCDLIGLARSTYYYSPNVMESPENLFVMRMIDKMYTDHPYYGSPRITDGLRDLGYLVNHKRVERLMRVMGIAAVLPGPHTSTPHPDHTIYPYLLHGMNITKPDQVWCADITYVPVVTGFLYLVAIMDWFSRYVLAWEISNTLETVFCLDALEAALTNANPGIFNTDQGAQFTSTDWTDRLKASQITISMNGRGRCLDNVFVERLWRTVKYENIYLHDYVDGWDLREGLGRYFHFYNTLRKHSSHENQTPFKVYRQARKRSTGILVGTTLPR
jgi:putative transposase